MPNPCTIRSRAFAYLPFCLLVLLTATLIVVPGQAGAAQNDATAQVQDREVPPPPGLFQVPNRARAVADSAAQAQQTIQRLGVGSRAAADLEEAEERFSDIEALLGSLVEMDVVRLERLSRLRDQALLEDSRLEGIRDRLSGRLDELATLRESWLDRQRTWRSWRVALAEEPDFREIAPEIDSALEQIDAVLAAASEAGIEPLALQRRVEALRAEIAQIGDIITRIRAGRREALLERTQPLLLLGQHRAQLAEEGWRGWDPTAGIEPRAYASFVRGHLGMLGFYLLLAIMIGVGVRRLRPRIGETKEWSGLLERPFSLGILITVVIAMVRITLAPPLWDVLLWALFGMAAARLCQKLFAARSLRLTVYLLAAFYPLFLLLEVAQLPDPVFRVGLAAVAAAAIPLFLILAREVRTPVKPADRRPEPGDGEPVDADAREKRRAWPLRIGAGVWIIVALAVVLGFDALGRWMLHAAAMTAAVAFVVVLAFAFMNATAATLSQSGGGRGLWWRAGALLAHRTILLFRIAVVVVAVLVLLDVWGVAESPLVIWGGIMNIGFSIGTLEFTIGSILGAVLVVYLALLLSGLLRSLLVGDAREFSGPGHPRLLGEIDSGLTQSVSKLAHYALITLGVVFALGVMGVQLQNFAIVAGALGIGVGFGLQNVVNNFASGLILLLERPVRVGDTVVVGDVWGTIRKIGLRSTIMLTLDQSEMIVPNADLVSEKVINWTLSNATTRVILPVGVAYGSPIADVLRILGDAAFAHDSVMKEPAPEVLFVGFGDSSLDFELRVWVQNVGLRLEVRSIVLQEVDRRFREASIEIPFPQRDLHLRSVDQATLERLREST